MVFLLIQSGFIQRNHPYFSMVNQLVELAFFDQFYLAQALISLYYPLLPLLLKQLKLYHCELLSVLIFEQELVYVNLLLLQLPLSLLQMLPTYHHLHHFIFICFKTLHFDVLEFLMIFQLNFLNVKLVLAVINSFRLKYFQIHFEYHHFVIRHFCAFFHYSMMPFKFHLHHFMVQFLIHLAPFL